MYRLYPVYMNPFSVQIIKISQITFELTYSVLRIAFISIHPYYAACSTFKTAVSNVRKTGRLKLPLPLKMHACKITDFATLDILVPVEEKIRV